MSKHKKLLAVLCLVVPGVLAEQRLSAEPSYSGECPVEIGKTYTLSTSSEVQARCKSTGCSSGSIRRDVKNAPVVLELQTNGRANVAVGIRHPNGEAERFTAPVSGKLTLPKTPPPPKDWQVTEIGQRYRDQCPDLDLESIRPKQLGCDQLK